MAKSVVKRRIRYATNDTDHDTHEAQPYAPDELVENPALPHGGRLVYGAISDEQRLAATARFEFAAEADSVPKAYKARIKRLLGLPLAE